MSLKGRATSRPSPAAEDESHSKRVCTRLTNKEFEQFRVVKKYVVGFCGQVSDAEMLRYLVRDWSAQDHQMRSE